MNANEKTLQQIRRALSKAASKFSDKAECMPLIDLIIQVKQESGELLVCDDNEVELTRCVVEEWIGNTDECFYNIIPDVLRKAINDLHETFERLPVMKPYSILLSGEDGETIADLCLFDDDLIVIDHQLMEGLSEDLDAFWEELSRK